MRLLYLTDRVSRRGGADQHLLQVVRCALSAGHQVTVAHGRAEQGVVPEGAEAVRVKGLATAIRSRARLARLEGLLGDADVAHVQNVMNPVALELAVSTGRAVVTVQDHRVFCPGPGKSLPDGSACREAMADARCASCLPDEAYRERAIALTRARLEALVGAKLLVLSRYMAGELATVGLGDAEVLPPWVGVSAPRSEPGEGFVIGGRLVGHKGVVGAWRSWRAAASGHPLRVAGEGPLGGDLAGAQLLGWLGSAELRRLLRSSRGLLFSARWQEPFGILGVEALAEGTPVVVARSGGTADWSQAGCLTVPAGDERSMTAALRSLAEEPSFARRLGESGRQAVAERFDRGRIEARLLAIYAEVAHHGAAGRGALGLRRPGGGHVGG